jgi:HAD superfamily hydrolase (TIGR01509 family)
MVFRGMIRGVIFDLDGTMVNTEDLWYSTSSEMARLFGKTFTAELNNEMMGRKESEGLAIFIDYFDLRVPVEELLQLRKDLLAISNYPIMPKEGLMELLDTLDDLRIKKAVASSGFHDYVYRILDDINLVRRFDAIITGDDITNGKPDPEIFLTAAKQLALNPDECLVLEDAQYGVEAAFNGNIKVIAIPHLQSKKHDFSKAATILSSMKYCTKEMITNLRSI